MREILFRGKRKDHGNWIFGWYCGKTCLDPFSDAVESSQIIEFDELYWHEVIPETVGQFTGLTDKNGKKIFEGDIVKSYDMFGSVDACGIVHWSKTFCSWHIDEYKSMYSERIATYEVIGNIHDKSELLED